MGRFQNTASGPMLVRATRECLGLLATVAIIGVPAQAQPAAVEARHGLVTSASELASRAGVEILKKGGNAVDAAVATGLALEVVYPIAGNLGGGGFMLIHLANGRNVAVDYRETAPAAAARNMYLGPDGKLVQGMSTSGWGASGVPGTVAGFAEAVEKFGSHRVTWADLCDPARRLAAEGFVVSSGTGANSRYLEAMQDRPGDSNAIRKSERSSPDSGKRCVQADLARTFIRLQRCGPRDFYEGETAHRIAEAMSANGGSITLADLKNYRAVDREPLTGKYRGYDVVTIPPPSSGGIALLQMLGMLEAYDIASLGQNSPAKIHLFAEVMKRAFRDRSEYLGDPAFVTIPVKQLLDPSYIRRRMADFDPDRATPAEAVRPGLGKHTPVGMHESNETTHFSVVDSAGNAVSNTYTLNGAFGSGIVIPGTGFLMNNQMDDFTSAIGVPNMYGLIQGEANAIAPGKRPVSSMTPAFVFKDGRLVLITGSPGGPTIINTVLQVITNVIDLRLDVQRAVDAPRINEQWLPDVVSYEHLGVSPQTAASLRSQGYRLKEVTRQGDAETIAVDPQTGLLFGAADPRNLEAMAAGY
jgi:gamma-glutamyltranspeptidase/glutathione hydrolase